MADTQKEYEQDTPANKQSPVPQEESQAVTAQETSLTDCTTDECAPPDEEEDKPVDLLDQRVFGMSRFQFWGAAGGFGLGYVLSGLLAMIGLPESISPTVVGLIVGGAGFLYMGRVHKRKVAQRDAAQGEDANLHS